MQKFFLHFSRYVEMYRGEKKGLHFCYAEPGIAVKQEQEEYSRNHVQTFFLVSVLSYEAANAITFGSTCEIHEIFFLASAKYELRSHETQKPLIGFSGVVWLGE